MATDLTRIREGRTALDVPAASLLKREPDTFPVFFNRAAKLNRDVAVAMTGALPGATYLDSLSGIGARGVRVAKEASETIRVTMNDFNAEAIELAKRNAEANGISERCSFSLRETNGFLHSRFSRQDKFDFVDVDPFGSPAPYVQGAIIACSDGGVVSATATDAPVLAGVHPGVSLRRYGSPSIRSAFKHEAAVRILLGYCSRVAASLDVGIGPIAAHSTKHYIRVYFRISRSATGADAALKNLGYVSSCPACGENQVGEGVLTRCNGCGARVRCAGPLWVGPVVDERTVGSAAAICQKEGFDEAEGLLRSLHGVDSFPPHGYDLEEMCSEERIASVSLQGVRDALSSVGRRSMRQPFERMGLKTDASRREVLEAVRTASAVVSEAG